MRIAAQRQAKVPCVARPVIGLHLRTQHLLHDQFLLCHVGHILDEAIEQRRGDHLAQRQAAIHGLEVVAQRNQLLPARRFVDAIDDGRGLGFKRLGGGDIGGDHEILDHPVSVEPFAHDDGVDAPLLVQHDAAFGQV